MPTLHRHAESLGLSLSAGVLAVATHATFLQWAGAALSTGLLATAISREIRLWLRPGQRA